MIAEMTVAMREMVLGGARDEATERQVEDAMREGREGLLPVMGVAAAAYQGLDKVLKSVDARVATMDPSNPKVADLELLSLQIHRVIMALVEVMWLMPEAVYNCWIEDKKATAETGKVCGVYLVKGTEVAPCQDN